MLAERHALCRPPIHPRVNEIAGDFTNLLFLEIFRDVETPFIDWARALQAQLHSHLDHSVVHGVTVLRSWARQGGPVALPIVFSSLLGSLAAVPGDDSAGDRIDSSARWLREPIFGMGQTPQVWLDHIVAEHQGTLVIIWDAVEALFPAGMLDDMLAAFAARILALAANEAAWEARCPDLLPPAHRALMAAANDTNALLSAQTLHGLFEAQATLGPAHPAVIEGERTLTYSELDRLGNRLARRLRELGATPNRLVAIVMEKGWEQIAAVLGVLKSGAAYLPVDAGWPSERCATLLATGQATVVLTQSRVDHTFPWPDAITRIVVDEAVAGDDRRLDAVQGAEDLAYVIFTSGSTGVPKGVMIEHRGPVNYLLDLNRRYDVGPSDRFIGLSSLSFDLSVYDIFGALAAGATLVLPSSGQQRDPAQWVQHLERGVSVWNTVPALMQLLVEYAAGRPDVIASMQTLRVVQLSGDWIPVGLPDAIRAVVPTATVVSVGGATETSINSIVYEVGRVEAAWTGIPWGRPMANQRAFVLDERLEPCPCWVPGELHVAGVGIARGYWGDPVQTAERFFIHPRIGERLCKSGDWARWLPDGNLEFLGRRDRQVKIHGHRIELGEIESTLERHPAVKQAVVVPVGDRDAQRLVAHIIPGGVFDDVTVDAGDGVAIELPPVLQDPEARRTFRRALSAVRDDLEITTVLERPTPASPPSPMGAESGAAAGHVSQAALAGLLECTRRIRNDYTALPKARYASGGSLYPVQVYVVVAADRVDGIDAGVYYYNPIDHALARVDEVTSLGSQAFTIVLVGHMAGVAPVYGPLSDQFCWIEAGQMVQVLESTARVQRLELSPVSQPLDDLRGAFGLHPADQLLLAFAGASRPTNTAGDVRARAIDEPPTDDAAVLPAATATLPCRRC